MSNIVLRKTANPDFTVFIMDGLLKTDGLDLSAIVPEGAIGVILDTSLGRTTDAPSMAAIYTGFQGGRNTFWGQSIPPGPGVPYNLKQQTILPLNPDRKMDYIISGAPVSLAVTVAGWII